MTRPNFIIVGVPKSGTTSLYNYCRLHPQVFMSRVKAPRFFLYDSADPRYGGPSAEAFQRDAIKDFAGYCALFEERKGAPVAGEATSAYFYAPHATARIAARLPDAKLVAVVRQPVDRALSDFRQMARQGLETAPSLGAAWADHDRRVRENWLWGSYRFRSTYYPHLKRHFDTFGRDRFRVFLFEDLFERPADMLRELWRFLEVDETFEVDVARRFNDGTQIDNPALKAIWNALRPLRDAVVPHVPVQARGYVYNAIASIGGRRHAPPALEPEERDALTATCRDDILRTQDLIERDLGAWLAPTPRKAPLGPRTDREASRR